MKKNKTITNLFIDTDMGVDDIMAICILLLSPTFKIRGFSFIDGVTRSNIGFKNLQTILKYVNKNIPIIKPTKQISTKSLINFPEIDRKRSEKLSLLTNLDLRSKTLKPKPLKKLKEILLDKNKLTIIALGPLTNIAKLLANPTKRRQVKEIIMMGGGINKGNVPPLNLVEYNILRDPESANMVFNLGVPITMVGIDATSCVPCTNEFKNQIQKIIPTTLEGKIIKEIIINNQNDFEQFYDPLVSFIISNPTGVKKSVTGFIKVVKTGVQKGKTNFYKNSKGNINVILEINSYEFYKYILNTLKGGEKNDTKRR